MSLLFEVVPASDIEAGDRVTEPFSGVVGAVQAVEPCSAGWRIVLGQVWCLYFEVDAERPIRRMVRP